MARPEPKQTVSSRAGSAAAWASAVMRLLPPRREPIDGEQGDQRVLRPRCPGRRRPAGAPISLRSRPAAVTHSRSWDGGRTRPGSARADPPRPAYRYNPAMADDRRVIVDLAWPAASRSRAQHSMSARRTANRLSWGRWHQAPQQLLRPSAARRHPGSRPIISPGRPIRRVRLASVHGRWPRWPAFAGPRLEA